MNKTISILIPTLNEEENIEKICLEIFKITANLNYISFCNIIKYNHSP